MLLKALVLNCLLLSGLSLAGKDVPLPVSSGDQSDLRLCEAVGYQGPKCAGLMDKLCASISNANSKCLQYQMAKCHEGGRERIHSPECLPVERRLCDWTNYKADDYVCELFLEEKCKITDFKSRRCLLLRQKLTVQRGEDRLGMNLSTSVLGHRNSKLQREQLRKAIDELDEAIRAADKGLSNPTIELSPYQKDLLKKNRREIQKQHDDIVPNFQDAE